MSLTSLKRKHFPQLENAYSCGTEGVYARLRSPDVRRTIRNLSRQTIAKNVSDHLEDP